MSEYYTEGIWCCALHRRMSDRIRRERDLGGCEPAPAVVAGLSAEQPNIWERTLGPEEGLPLYYKGAGWYWNFQSDPPLGNVRGPFVSWAQAALDIIETLQCQLAEARIQSQTAGVAAAGSIHCLADLLQLRQELQAKLTAVEEANAALRAAMADSGAMGRLNVEMLQTLAEWKEKNALLKLERDAALRDNEKLQALLGKVAQQDARVWSDNVGVDYVCVEAFDRTLWEEILTYAPK